MGELRDRDDPAVMARTKFLKHNIQDISADFLMKMVRLLRPEPKKNDVLRLCNRTAPMFCRVFLLLGKLGKDYEWNSVECGAEEERGRLSDGDE